MAFGDLTPHKKTSGLPDPFQSTDVEFTDVGFYAGGEMRSRAWAADLERTIEDLELSHRAQRVLRDAGIASVGELLSYTPEELSALAGFGERSLEEVADVLAERDLSLGCRANRSSR